MYGIVVFSIPFKSATPPKAERGERAVFSQLVDYYDKPAESSGSGGGGGSSDFQTGEFFTPTTPTERAAVLTAGVAGRALLHSHQHTTHNRTLRSK